MFRIKICGVTGPKDCQLIALAGADAVGLNFYAESPRFLEPATAEKIAASISPKLAKVGVFVNASLEVLRETSSRLQLNWVQLHGDEPPEVVAADGLPSVLKAFRIGPAGIQPVLDYVAACRGAGKAPDAVLLDAAKDGEFGGTGQTVDWNLARQIKEQLAGIPVVLAGGLTPFNVAEAIATSRPDAVDVASGVESKPGTKDLMLIRAFVMNAKKALDA